MVFHAALNPKSLPEVLVRKQINVHFDVEEFDTVHSSLTLTIPEMDTGIHFIPWS